MHVLNLGITLPIEIKRKQRYRWIDAISEIGFGMGTGLIALSAILGDKWKVGYWYFVILSYLIWIVFSIIIKLWKG